jgi:hypothetical protein
VPAKRKERYFLNNLGEVLENAGIKPAVVDASSRMQEQEQEQQTR